MYESYNNLPVATTVHTVNNPEIATLNPVNITPVAMIATNEDINGEEDVELAHIVPSSLLNLPVPPPPPSPATPNINIEENPDLIFIPISDRRNITKFMNTRKISLIFYSPIMILNLLYILVNPIGLLFIINIFYNLFTLISGDIRFIKSNIFTNISTIICIIFVDILFSFNIDTLLFYILNKAFSVLNVELYYLSTLYVLSILIIMTYLYLTLTLNKLRLLYNTFTPHQINILKILLKNK